MKYAWIDQHRDIFALSEMCAVLDVSIASYRAWGKGGKPHRKRLTDSQMIFHIQVIHAEVKRPTAVLGWSKSCVPEACLLAKIEWNA